ncbi:hypothetical protein GCM10009789_61940 [Kribbella sancticallisti]|uniref:PIN domain-containing protein n=1 Tax=Kribbella sancticallisti TaxID=460087 RepID=A0ABN2ECB3_9ACTN
MRSIVYDADALVAAERRSPDLLALHDELTAAHIRRLVPVVVLAQVWRRGPQHQISRLLKGCDIVSDDQRIGRGQASSASPPVLRTSSTRSWSSQPCSIKRQWLPVTPDRGDLTHLASSIGFKLHLFTV